jgi:hypothetical protein
MQPAILTLCALLAFPAFAEPSGVLVGLQDSTNQYRTIWMVAEGGVPVVSAVVKGLVVPRESGLWRMDVALTRCGEVDQYQVDELSIRPLEAASGTATIQNCEAIAKASCGAVYPASGGLVMERWISYAGPTHFAEQFWLTESCGADPVWETGFSVRDLDHPEQDVAMQTVFLSDRVDALKAAAREALVCATDDLDCIDSLDPSHLSLSSGWGIARAQSQWSVVVAVASLDPSLAPSPVVTDVEPPVAILGLSEDQKPAEAIEGLPEGDQSISPDGDMVIVRTDQVVAYRLGSGTVEGPPVLLPTKSGEQVVMVEWASKSQVAPWGAVLRGLSNEAAGMSQSTGIDRVAWLRGCWETVSENRIIEEQWMAPRGDSMLGISRTLRDGSLVGYELVVLREQGEELAYEAHPSGQPSAVFVSSAVGAQRIAFENPGHDFPKRIGYERRGDDLLAWIEGTQDGQVRRIEFPYHRAACPGE